MAHLLFKRWYGTVQKLEGTIKDLRGFKETMFLNNQYRASEMYKEINFTYCTYAIITPRLYILNRLFRVEKHL